MRKTKSEYCRVDSASTHKLADFFHWRVVQEVIVSQLDFHCKRLRG